MKTDFFVTSLTHYYFGLQNSLRFITDFSRLFVISTTRTGDEMKFLQGLQLRREILIIPGYICWYKNDCIAFFFIQLSIEEIRIIKRFSYLKFCVCSQLMISDCLCIDVSMRVFASGRVLYMRECQDSLRECGCVWKDNSVSSYIFGPMSVQTIELNRKRK